MDNSLNQNTTQQNQSTQQSQAADQHMQQSVLKQPISNPVREQGPINQPQEQLIQPAEHTPALHPEVERAGVEVSKNPEVLNLSLEDKKAGLEPAKESVPVMPTGPSFAQVMSQQQAQTVVKKGKFSDSITALAILILKQFKEMGLKKKGER